MKGRKDIPLIILTVIALLIGIGGYLAGGVESAKKDSDRFYLKNTGGSVMFSHKEHKEYKNDDCTACHHALYLSSEFTSCSAADCHEEGDFEIDYLTHSDMKEIEDHSCEGCHPVGKDAEAQSCRSCHPAIQEASDTFVTCAKSDCHEEGDFAVDDLTHAEMREIEDHNCEGCHTNRSVSDIYHDQCSSCHLQADKEKFTREDGSTRCEMCHLK